MPVSLPKTVFYVSQALREGDPSRVREIKVRKSPFSDFFEEVDTGSYYSSGECLPSYREALESLRLEWESQRREAEELTARYENWIRGVGGDSLFPRFPVNLPQGAPLLPLQKETGTRHAHDHHPFL